MHPNSCKELPGVTSRSHFSSTASKPAQKDVPEICVYTEKKLSPKSQEDAKKDSISRATAGCLPLGHHYRKLLSF